MADPTGSHPLDSVDAFSLVTEALAVANAAHTQAPQCSDAYYGVCVLLERVTTLVETATTTESPSEEAYDLASNAIGGADVLIARFNNQVDDLLLHAVASLLELAKKKVDADWFVLEQAS